MRSLLRMKKHIKKILDLVIEKIGPHKWPKHKNQLIVLSYHRILPKSHPDNGIMQPGMVVYQDTFEMHLDVLSKYFEFVDINEWIRKDSEGISLPRNACAITFDDGWVDNYQYAYPLLKERKIPATIYLVSSMLTGNSVFWPERLSRLLLDGGVGKDKLYQHNELSKVLGSVCVVSSIVEIDSIIEKCKIYTDEQLHGFLDEIEESYQNETVHSDLLGIEQVKEMLESGLISIGCHTDTHSRLNKISDTTKLETEIVTSKSKLNEIFSVDVATFCYPNGFYSNK